MSVFDPVESDPFLARYVKDLDALGPCLDTGSIDLAGASQEDVAVARVTWAARVVDEYRSAVVFTELLGLLAAIEAPFECQATVQRLIGDELRHAGLCASALELLGGGVHIDLSDLGLPPTDEAPGPRAYEVVVRELVVAEAESVPMLRAYRDACEEPALREILHALLRDEVRHAATGPRLARALERHLPAGSLDDLRPRLATDVEGDVAHLRALYRDSARGGAGRRFGASIEPAELHEPGPHAWA